MKKIHHIRLATISILVACYQTPILAAAENSADTLPDPQAYLQNLTPEQTRALQQTAQERLNNLTPAQKQELMQVAQEYLNDISPAEKQVLMESTKGNLNMTSAQKQTVAKTVQGHLDNLTPDQKQALKQLQQAAETPKTQ